jgi:MoaA/NifB/PqqE/SkfB family radical SAM enzyme
MSSPHRIHDFGSKLAQPAVRARMVEYVQWQREMRLAAADDRSGPELPARAPISINLDLTTACNYRCDHCCDWEILNSGIRHDERQLRESLARLTDAGLKSVILIGGGEPTVYPRFSEMVRFLKCDLGLQVAIVSNGSRNDRVLDAAEWLRQGDWIRLSLDAGTDATFQAMHRPKQPVTLEEICRWVPRIKARQQDVPVGFSFVLTWTGASRDDAAIVENLDELPLAARLARDHGFDYLSVKPFVGRDADDRSQVLDADRSEQGRDVVAHRVRDVLEAARALQTESFRIVESANLRSLWAESAPMMSQPRRCHMQFFRQVLTPQGIFNCPAHRGLPDARIAGREGYCDEHHAQATRACVGRIIEDFNATERCRNVTCIYNSTNWLIEGLIEDPCRLDDLPVTVDGADFFL